MTLSTHLSNANILISAWLRRKALRLLFGKTIIVCTCGAVCDFNTHRKDHFYCGYRLTNQFRGTDSQLEKMDSRLADVERNQWELSEVEMGHAMGLADRLKVVRQQNDSRWDGNAIAQGLMRKQIAALEQKVDVAGGLCSLGEVPVAKVQQLIERYKIVRSYVRGISERQRTLERAMGLSVSLDGPQRFKDEACELLMQVLEHCPLDTMPLLVCRIVNLLDNSGHEGWSEK